MSTSAQNCIIMATLQNIAVLQYIYLPVLQCATPLQCQCKVQYQYFTHFHFTLTSVIILLAPHWIVKCFNFSNSTCFITLRFKWFWIKLVLRHQRYYSIIEWLLTFESLIDLILWDYDDCNAEKPSDSVTNPNTLLELCNGMIWIPSFNPSWPATHKLFHNWIELLFNRGDMGYINKNNTSISHFIILHTSCASLVKFYTFEENEIP